MSGSQTTGYNEYKILSAIGKLFASLQLVEVKREQHVGHWEEEYQVQFRKMCEAFGIPCRWMAMEWHALQPDGRSSSSVTSD